MMLNVPEKGKGPDHTPEAAMRSAWQITYAALSHCGLPNIVLRRGLQKRQYSKQNPCAQVDKIDNHHLHVECNDDILDYSTGLHAVGQNMERISRWLQILTTEKHGTWKISWNPKQSKEHIIFWIPANNTKPTKASMQGHLRPRPLGFTTFDDRCKKLR